MNMIPLVIGSALLGFAGMSTWLAVQANQEVGRLEEQKATLTAAYEHAANERNQLDRIYTKQIEESQRVQANLERQLDGIRQAQAGACADAAVSAERIEWLQQPVWLDAPASSNSP